ncbi:F0F1 ATP synthase subunit B [Mycoplasma phocimorsus]|uniref:ATP synthase subunit b n=1 Tax=Mycoplasma phocimorsus TaxID=3045839 RepID=A0AAJ1PS50_9MOLU|nr:F0F1 ATP synthase subunit B [Mycoplasma phocimorsus]MDJ1645519.1 F0F1 ATP synthase subunit B [Mycoplasma phocimorsus]MDJ1646213.1 F0F1 ATP synthase subunit B [Mycoplasma phocimorsus]MDJ1646811.1 F0F1 ATP synthase subunit B [Mycoplasma phocimorsus]MDJ1647785.1 F0F1 ATP synthase subunit B [Mycoplasma phocimorsus]MDJ1648199.1 F0F1 ATP synthase subunit B [Mycoplasma phocimorsus]
MENNINITERFQQIFPNLPLLIATIIAFLITFLFLSVFFYNPVKRMVEKRRKFIADNIKNSIEDRQKALEDRNESQEKLIDAKIKASEIVNKAKFEAEKVIIQYTNIAQNEAERIKHQAEIEIENEKVKFEKNSKQAIIDVAFELANKLVEKELRPENEKKLIEDFFK